MRSYEKGRIPGCAGRQYSPTICTYSLIVAVAIMANKSKNKTDMQTELPKKATVREWVGLGVLTPELFSYLMIEALTLGDIRKMTVNENMSKLRVSDKGFLQQ